MSVESVETVPLLVLGVLAANDVDVFPPFLRTLCK
jgi:hypothetical protein